MVEHIVLWKLKEGVDRAEAVREIRSRTCSLVGLIEGLVSARVDEGFDGYDVALHCLLESRAALDAYQAHPAHVEAKNYIAQVISSRVFCDIEQST